MGPGWTPDYFWSNYLKTYYPNGNIWDNSCTGEWGFPGPLGVSDWPTTWSGHPAFRLADGGTVVFGDTVWTHAATQIIDPYGQSTTITLNSSTGQITQVTEPGGRYLQFFYTTIGGGQFLTEVDAYDGLGNRIDYVVYHYSSEPTGGNIVTSATCLTSVDYSDGQHASYTYTTDNAPEQPNQPCPCSVKAYPLVYGCNDVRYHGAMRRIAYGYQDPGPHGAILNEKYWDGVAGDEGNGPTVSSINPPAPAPLLVAVIFPTTYTETRGDSPTRTFNYTSLTLGRPGNDALRPSWSAPNQGPAPQQFLQSYTDFQGHTTYLGYDSNWYVNSVTDARGSGPGDPNYTTTYARASPPPTSIGQITKITHPDGTHIDYTFQSEPGAIGGHYVATVSDERQDVTVYTRDPTTYLVTEIDYKNAVGALLAYETFTYNPFGQVLQHRLKNGATESFVYDGRGLLTDKYNPKFGVPGGTDPHTHYDYYTSADGKLGWIDRVKKMTLPANGNGLQASETYEYDRALGADGLTNLNGGVVAGRGLVTKISHADGTYQTFKYDAYGNKGWQDNELRQANSYTYDDYKRLLTATNPLSKTTTYTYNPTNTTGSPYLHTTTNADTVTTPTGIVTKNVYDQNFRKTSTTAAYGTTLAATTWLHYDAVGNQDYVTDPRGTSTPGNYTTYTDYDSRNRKWQVREPLSHTTQFYYDDGINITRIVRVADNTTETKVYDGMNRISSDTVPKSTNPTVNIVTQFTYYPYNVNSGSLLWQVIDGNNHYFTFAYDPFGSKTQLTYPGSVSSQSWAYDGANNLMSRTTVGSETQSFQYDNRNRKTQMTWNNNAEWAQFWYDGASRLTEAKNGTGGTVGQNVISDVTRQYDAAGHLTLDQQNVTGLGIKSVNYPSYDDDGRLTRMYVAGVSGYDFTYSYDSMGRFEKIFLTNSSQLFQYYYDAASNETERANLYNGVNQVYAWDALDRMTSWDVKKGTSTLAHEGYTSYNAMNQITGVDWANGHTDSFTYYLDGELEQAVLGNFNQTLTYNLDLAGNRTTVVDSVNGTTTYTPNSVNQYTSVSGSSICNGPEHQISCFNSVTYTYMNDEQLTQVSDGGTNNYWLYYDALGRCVGRILNGILTYYIYDGEKPILEYDGSGTSVGTNLYGKGIDEILERVAIGSVYFPQQNHEGSVTLLTSTSGTAIERYRYDAFGAPTIYDGNWNGRSATIYDNRFLFTGREYAATYRSNTTPAFNFYEYRARAYNPKLGRFMSEDPKVFDAGDYNLFRYCHNDPVDNVDPMGTTDVALPPGPNHASPLIEESARQLLFDRSFGAVSVGLNQQFFQAVANFINSARSDAAGVNPSAIGRALFRDAKDAANDHAKNIRLDQYGRRRLSEERAYAELVKKGGGLERQGPFIGKRDEQGQPYTELTFSRPPISISHSHGPESGAGLDRGDVPSANGHNPMGVPYISSVGWTGDLGRTIHIYVPSGGNTGQFFHATNETTFLPGP